MDIKNKIINTVGNANEKFSQDVLRILRAIRFATVLNFKLSDEVVEAINKSKAKVMYLCNAMTQPCETDNFGVSDHIKVLEKYLGENTINVTNWFPIACVHDDRGWNLKSYETVGDPFYSETSNFYVKMLIC